MKLWNILVFLLIISTTGCNDNESQPHSHIQIPADVIWNGHTYTATNTPLQIKNIGYFLGNGISNDVPMKVFEINGTDPNEAIGIDISVNEYRKYIYQKN